VEARPFREGLGLLVVLGTAAAEVGYFEDLFE
jgi:hypothetical protein